LQIPEKKKTDGIFSRNLKIRKEKKKRKVSEFFFSRIKTPNFLISRK
jgi:hypothetical protein